MRTESVGRKKKEILVAVLATGTTTTNNINLTLYEFGRRQTVLTIAIK
jgi:hypothetical protein